MRLVDVPLDMTFAEALGPDAKPHQKLMSVDYGCHSWQPDPIHARG